MLVRVGNSGVEVRDLVENHVLEVDFVEVVGEFCSEIDRELLVQELEQAVDEGGGDCEKSELENSGDKKTEFSVDDGLDDSARRARDIDTQLGSEPEEEGESNDGEN